MQSDSWMPIAKQYSKNSITKNIKNFFDENCPYHFLYGCNNNNCTKKHSNNELNSHIKDKLQNPVGNLLDYSEVKKIKNHFQKKFKKNIKLMICINFLENKCTKKYFEKVKLKTDDIESTFSICYQIPKNTANEMTCYIHLTFDFIFQNGNLNIKNIQPDDQLKKNVEEKERKKNFDEEYPALTVSQTYLENITSESIYDGNTGFLFSQKYNNLEEAIKEYKINGNVSLEKFTNNLLNEVVSEYLRCKQKVEELRDISQCIKLVANIKENKNQKLMTTKLSQEPQEKERKLPRHTSYYSESNECEIDF